MGNRLLKIGIAFAILGAIICLLSCLPDKQYLVAFEKNKERAKRSIIYHCADADVSLKITSGGNGGYAGWQFAIGVALKNEGDQKVEFNMKNGSINIATCHSFIPSRTTVWSNGGTDDEKIILDPHEKGVVRLLFSYTDCGKEFLMSDWLELQLPFLLALGDSARCEVPVIYAFPR